MQNLEDRSRYFTNVIQKRIEEEKTSIIESWNHPVGTMTRHFFIDNLLPDKDVKEIYNAFPRGGDGFFNRKSFREQKRTSANLTAYPPILTDITYAFQNDRILATIQDLLGLERIEPDPKLYAGGLSMMFPGDYLNPHIDNSHDGDRKSYRRLNLLYYVSPDWKEEYGANFELWNSDRSIPKTIISKENRLLVMETNKTSWHSVSPNLSDNTRCCVSNYYFSPISPDGSDYYHVTSFLGRPNQKIRNTVGFLDNAIRNTVSKTLRIGRGKGEINKIAK